MPFGVTSSMRVGAQVDERDVVAVERLEVARRRAPAACSRAGSRAARAPRPISGSFTVRRTISRNSSTAISLASRSFAVSVQIRQRAEAELLERRLALLGGALEDLPVVGGERRITAPVVPAVPLKDSYCSSTQLPVSALIAACSSSVSGLFCDGHVNAAVRWNTVRCSATLASSGIACTPDEPVPTMPMRLPSSSTPSSGHRLVCTIVPSNESIPGSPGGSAPTARRWP